MKHLDNFQIFENKIKQEALLEKGSAPAGWSNWFYDFFKDMQNRFENFDSYYKQNIAMKDKTGKPIDTGLGWLIGTAGSLATGVAAKLFEPGDFASKNGQGLLAPKKDADITPQHKRLFNDNFKQNDLPKMNSDADFQNWASAQYKKAGVKPGQDKTVDSLVGDASKSFFGKSRGVATGSEIASGTAATVGAEGTGIASTVGEVVSAIPPIVP
jgi:hypothetical protein